MSDKELASLLDNLELELCSLLLDENPENEKLIQRKILEKKGYSKEEAEIIINL